LSAKLSHSIHVHSNRSLQMADFLDSDARAKKQRDSKFRRT